jgi:hypothetical protein
LANHFKEKVCRLKGFVLGLLETWRLTLWKPGDSHFRFGLMTTKKFFFPYIWVFLYLGVVFPIRCRKWFRELPNNRSFLACGPSETRKAFLLPHAVVQKSGRGNQAGPKISPAGAQNGTSPSSYLYIDIVLYFLTM